MVERAQGGPTRRSVVLGGVVAAVGASTGGTWWPGRAGGAVAAAAGGLAPVSMAMHIHASFSEGSASMQAHLDQATRNGVDVVWWTEHDHRMAAYRYRRTVSFDGPAESEDGLSWAWTRKDSGPLASGIGEFVSSPASPDDPHPPGSLHLGAKSSTTAWATRAYEGAAQDYRMRTSLDGHVLRLDLLPVSTARNAYLALDLVTSYRPPTGGRTGGPYTLSYRIGGDRPVGSRVASGRTGVITSAATPGRWQTLTLDPVADLAALWPDLESADASLVRLLVRAVSRSGGWAEGYVDYLRFERSRKDGDAPLAVQRELMARYAAVFPAVDQRQGLELSVRTPHICWYGSTISLPDFTASTAPADMVRHVHAYAGLASYTHPFGSTGGAVATTAVQERMRRTVTTAVLNNRALGCDLLEVGYRSRGGVDLDRHAMLWDSCSRNALFLTGTGVSDDHDGNAWLDRALNFLTWVWAPSRSVSDLVDALAAGRAWFGDPKRFRGELDLLVDDTVPMGAVSLDPGRASRSVRVIATSLPKDARVQLLRGVVDLAGPTQTDPPVHLVADAPAPITGALDVEVDTSTPCFVRAVVRDGAGLLVAFSNPVWLLHDAPPAGIPLSRQA